MTTEISPTERQRELLQTAGAQFSGSITPAAEAVRLFGGARETMCLKLKELGLIEESSDGQMILSAAAYGLLEQMPPEGQVATPEALPVETISEAPEVNSLTEEDQPSPEPEPAEAPAPKARKARENTKQAKVIEMLRRLEGATLEQVMEMTGWQKHTARSVLSRQIQKGLGLPLVSEKSSGSERVYRIREATEETQTA